MRFVIVDHTAAKVPNLGKIAAALQLQCTRDATGPRPANWNFAAATVRVGAPGAKGDVVIGLFDQPDQPGALGYHDVAPDGTPLIKVFPTLDAQDGVSVSSTLSHEVLETLADPEGVWCAQNPADGSVWAAEICDAVEATSYAINGVEVSNFCLPGYFTGIGKFDFLGLLKAPYSMLPGGYSQTLGPQGWTQVYADAGRARRFTFAQGQRRRG